MLDGRNSGGALSKAAYTAKRDAIEKRYSEALTLLVERLRQMPRSAAPAAK